MNIDVDNLDFFRKQKIKKRHFKVYLLAMFIT